MIQQSINNQIFSWRIGSPINPLNIRYNENNKKHQEISKDLENIRNDSIHFIKEKWNELFILIDNELIKYNELKKKLLYIIDNNKKTIKDLFSPKNINSLYIQYKIYCKNSEYANLIQNYNKIIIKFLIIFINYFQNENNKDVIIKKENLNNLEKIDENDYGENLENLYEETKSKLQSIQENYNLFLPPLSPIQTTVITTETTAITVPINLSHRSCAFIALLIHNF